MTDKITGGCLCGSVRYECDPEQFVGGALCHCRDCQYITGGSAAVVVGVPETAFELTAGEVKGYTVKSEAGNDVTRQFCASCGTPLFSLLSVAPGLRILKIGSFDDPNKFKPVMTVWTSSAPEWATLNPDLPKFEKDPQ